jgi:Zn-dependent protease
MDLGTLAVVMPIVFASLTLHELAHAWVAWKLGDPTAKEQGRITLNPIVHADPLGTLMFVITALAPGSFVFGWAKPVPVQPGYFRRPKEGMAIVAAAGPAMNFVCALVCLALLRHLELSEFWTDVLGNAYVINVVLGIFNLIPIPPLDGSRIIAVIFDNATYVRWRQLDQYGMFVVFGLFFVFRDAFTQVLGGALENVTQIMDVVVFA